MIATEKEPGGEHWRAGPQPPRRRRFVGQRPINPHRPQMLPGSNRLSQPASCLLPDSSWQPQIIPLPALAD